MKVLVACEESQEVCKAFRELGHEAYSCDIQECSGGHPEWHLKQDVLSLLYEPWDLIIAHPPCTRLCSSGQRWLYYGDSDYREKKLAEQKDAIAFFMKFVEAAEKTGIKMAIENLCSRISEFLKSKEHGIYGSPGLTESMFLIVLPNVLK